MSNSKILNCKIITTQSLSVHEKEAIRPKLNKKSNNCDILV